MTAAEVPGSASPRVLDRLRRTPDGEYPLVHRGRHAVYAALPRRAGPRSTGGWALGIVAAPAAAVPCAVRVALPALPEVTRLEVRDGTVHLDGVPVPVRRLLDVSVPRLSRPPAPAAPAARPVELDTLPDPADLDSLPRLVGRGSGLTPLGDDVLCGWLAAHRAVGVPTPAHDGLLPSLVGRTTLLSATLLECAARGEAVPELVGWLAALGTPAESAARERLLGLGHTSGAGLLAGATSALRRLEAEAAA